jgi:hypothetical protein
MIMDEILRRLDELMYTFDGIVGIDGKYNWIFNSEDGRELIQCLANIRSFQGGRTQIDRILDHIGESMPSKKGMTLDLLRECIRDEERKKVIDRLSKSQSKGFSSKNLQVGSKDQSIFNPHNVGYLLRTSLEVEMVYDEMSKSTFFTKFPWQNEIDAEYHIPNAVSNLGDFVFHKFAKNNYHYNELCAYLNELNFPAETNFRLLENIVRGVAREKRIDTFKLWMNSFPEWNGIDNQSGDNNWIVKVLGVTPGARADEIARLIPLSLVCRCYDPGGIMRIVFILIGDEEIGKTRFIEELTYPQIFTRIDFHGHKDMDENVRRLEGRAQAEIAELGGAYARDQNLIKNFFSQRMMVHHKLYVNDPDFSPSRNVFFMTTNEERFLRDQTGNTRYAPFECTKYDHELWDKLKAQVFAQAIAQFKVGEAPFFLNKDVQIEMIKERVVNRVEDIMVEDYVALQKGECEIHGLTMEEIVTAMCDTGDNKLLLAEKMTKHTTNLKFALRRAGWVSAGQKMVKGERLRKWYPKDHPEVI